MISCPHREQQQRTQSFLWFLKCEGISCVQKLRATPYLGLNAFSFALSLKCKQSGNKTMGASSRH